MKNLLTVQEPQEMQVHLWVRKVPWSRPRQPLQYSYLENVPMNRGAWRAIVLGIAESQLKQFSTLHAQFT